MSDANNLQLGFVKNLVSLPIAADIPTVKNTTDCEIKVRGLEQPSVCPHPKLGNCRPTP
jgi:hypothetical protein